MNIFNSIARGAADLSPSCKEAARLQSLALDHRLALSQKLGLRMHLVLCKWCRRYGKQITFLRNAARDFTQNDPGPPPQSLSPEACARIKRKIAAEKGGAGS